LLVCLLAIPLFTYLAIIATQLVSLVLTSLWLKFEGGNPSLLIWGPLNLFDIWLRTLLFVLAVPLWLSPFIGWFLFVSAYARRAPLAFAFMPIFILPMVEKIVFGSEYLAKAVFVRTVSMPIFGIDSEGVERMFEFGEFEQEELLSLVGAIDLGKFLGSPSLWAGIAVCAAFTAGAIYLRRYRDES
jgi:ABC-2 type transport system permease protein